MLAPSMMGAPIPPPPAWLGGGPLGGVVPPWSAASLPRDRYFGLRTAAGVLGILAGAALVASSVMTWVRADITGVGMRNGSGWQNVVGNTSHGPVVTAAGVLVALGAALVLVGAAHRVARWSMAIGTLAGLGFAIWELIDLNDPGRGVTSTIGIGIWAMFAGAGLGLIATSLALATPRPRAVSPSAATVSFSGAVGAVG